MRTNFPRLGRGLAAGSAALILAACGGSTVAPTWSDENAAMKSTTQAAAADPVSAMVRGSVVDPANRLLANVSIECLGDVQCTQANYDVASDGHQHRIAQTDANGGFQIVARSLPGTSSTGFTMNANGQGYEVAWQQVAWPGPACSSDQPRCTVTVSFKLNPTNDPTP